MMFFFVAVVFCATYLQPSGYSFHCSDDDQRTLVQHYSAFYTNKTPLRDYFCRRWKSARNDVSPDQRKILEQNYKHIIHHVIGIESLLAVKKGPDAIVDDGGLSISQMWANLIVALESEEGSMMTSEELWASLRALEQRARSLTSIYHSHEHESIFFLLVQCFSYAARLFLLHIDASIFPRYQETRVVGPRKMTNRFIEVYEGLFYQSESHQREAWRTNMRLAGYYAFISLIAAVVLGLNALISTTAVTSRLIRFFQNGSRGGSQVPQ